jgi:hypothetical protein
MECYTAPSLKVAVITLEVIDIFNDILIPDELYALVYSKEYLSDMNRLIATIPPINVTEFECLSAKLNIKMRKILTGCIHYKYSGLYHKLKYLCKAHNFLLLGI